MKTTFSLRVKLFLLSATLLLFSGVVGVVSYWSANKIAKSYAHIDEVNFPGTRDVLKAVSSYRAARVYMLELGSPDTSQAQDEISIKKFRSNWNEFDEAVKSYTSEPFEAGEEALYGDWINSLKVIRQEMEDVGLFSDNTVYDAAKKKELLKLNFEKITIQNAPLREKFEKLLAFHKDSAAAASGEAKSANTTGQRWIVSLLVVALVSGMGIALVLSGSLVKAFKVLSESLDQSSDQVSEASTQIAAASQTLSQATTQQAAALEQTASAIEQMSSMVNKSSENANSAASTSNESKNSAEKGKVVVQQMIQSMNEIDVSNTNIMEQINHSNQELEGIVKVIQEIGTKTKVINDIVFQTKLLSFNASVEAARAGENGKGFAVVAEEVGKLAQMSGNAAKEITDLLDGSINKVENIVKETKVKVEGLVAEGKEKVETGKSVALHCSDVLSEIVTNVSGVAVMAEEISAASKEQAQGVVEITKAMQQLDQMTQQNAATSEDAAHSADALSKQAVSLKGVVASLVINIQGGESA